MVGWFSLCRLKNDHAVFRNDVFFTVALDACCLSAKECKAFGDGTSSQTEIIQPDVIDSSVQHACYDSLVITPLDDRVDLFTTAPCRSLPIAAV